MIRHVVMWKFKPEEQEKMKAFIEGLLALEGKIKELKYMEVGMNKNETGKNYDAVLISDFESLEDLQAYSNHPSHKAVSEICKEIRTDRVAVDYEY